MSLLAEYFKEIGTKEIIEKDGGFVTYYFIPEGIYVEDIFVQKEYRGTGLAKQMLDEIADIARSKGVTSMFGSTCPSSKTSTEALKAAFHYGFKLYSSRDNFILYRKDV